MTNQNDHATLTKNVKRIATTAPETVVIVITGHGDMDMVVLNKHLRDVRS